MTLDDRGRRQRARRAGLRAEAVAVLWLRLKGYRILERGLRIGGAEVDIVARRGSALIFAEVKARADRASAPAAITPAQQRRIARAAQVYIARLPDAARLTTRFDALLVTPRRFPVHIVDAWRPDD